MVDADVFFKTGLGTTIGGSIGSVGPVTVAGLPSTYHINVDTLPKIQLGIDKLAFAIDPVTLNPLELRLTELPSMRNHLPADFSVGLSILGLNVLCVRLCGEAQIISEPYRPNPCERCGQPADVPTPPNG